MTTFRRSMNWLKARVPSRLWLGARRAFYAALEFFRGLGPRVASFRYSGIRLYYNRGSSIIRRTKRERVFEEGMCRAIVAELSEKAAQGRGAFVDVGANLGLISAYVTSRLPAARIFAFEPGPVQRSFLEMTVAKNGLQDRVTVSGSALGREPGELTFYAHDPKYAAGDGLIDTGRAHLAHAIRVKVDTLDSWWKTAGRPPVGVLKIDTEGAELWVLEGGREFLQAMKPTVFLEIEPLNLRVYPHTASDVIRFLAEQGYAVTALGTGRAVDEGTIAAALDEEDTFVARAQ